MGRKGMSYKMSNASEGKRLVHPNREKSNDTIFYAKNHEDIPRKLRDVLEPLLFDERIELYRSLASLKQRLCLPTERRIIAILFAADKEDLMDIISMKYFFCNVQIVLILPNRKKEIIALGHTLRPRFVTYRDGDFRELLSVMRKMTGSSAKTLGAKANAELYGK